jgi:hypothetical protein
VRERRAIARALVVVVGCAGATWGFVAADSGCQLQGVCDPKTVNVPSEQSLPAGAGYFRTANGGVVWQTSALDGTGASGWLTFPPQITYNITLPPLPDGGAFLGPYVPVANISADANPYVDPQNNFAPSAGNTTQVTGLYVDGGVRGDASLPLVNVGVSVTNNTCTPYFLWLQLAQDTPLDADAGSGSDVFVPDAAGQAGDASTTDAADDASNDAHASKSDAGED